MVGAQIKTYYIVGVDILHNLMAFPPFMNICLLHAYKSDGILSKIECRL